MTHAGHEIVKCICGKILKQCRCAMPNKPVAVQSPCKCEAVGIAVEANPQDLFGCGEEETLQKTLAQVARDTCRNHKGAQGCCYVINRAVATAIENYKED